MGTANFECGESSEVGDLKLMVGVGFPNPTLILVVEGVMGQKTR